MRKSAAEQPVAERWLFFAFWILTAVGVTLAAWSAFAWTMAGPNQRIDWKPSPPPTATEIDETLAALPGPTFWFGPSVRGKRLSSVEQDYGDGDWSRVSFTYGTFCEQPSRGSGLSCTDQGTVSTSNRRPSSLSTARASCWLRIGRAWLIDCPGQYANWYGPRLLTGKRVVRFDVPVAGAGDRIAIRPWRESIGLLEEYGHPERGAAALPATARVTAWEFGRLGPAARQALPSELRPTG